MFGHNADGFVCFCKFCCSKKIQTHKTVKTGKQKKERRKREESKKNKRNEKIAEWQQQSIEKGDMN